MKHIALIVLLFLSGCSSQEIQPQLFKIISASSTQPAKEIKVQDSKPINVSNGEYVTEILFDEFDLHNNGSMGSYDEVYLMTPKGAWITWKSGDIRAPISGDWFKVERLSSGPVDSIFVRLINNSGQDSSVKIGAVKTNTGKVYN